MDSDQCPTCGYYGPHWQNGTVYVMTCHLDNRPFPFLKVGYSKHPNLDRRRKQLEVAAPFQLTIQGFRTFECATMARLFERKIHEEMKSHSMRGEWYFATREVLEVLAEYDLLATTVDTLLEPWDLNHPEQANPEHRAASQG